MKFSQLHVESRFLTLPAHFYHHQSPQPISSPQLRCVNAKLANTLGFTEADLASPEFIQLVSGQRNLESASPLAMKYSGHQFGSYNPELGDGRGLLIAEIKTAAGQHYDLHLKGSGKTPFSRFGDGRAVLRSTIREYLASETMHALGIPTTRALSLVSSNEPVQREGIEKAAMLVRVSSSHIRFGHFEYCFYTQQHDSLKQLADYVINQYYPECLTKKDPYLAMLESIIEQTAEMVASWQASGFCHGVMNTDNMSILGETFDYGPYAFLDDYNPSYICNHSDYSGRYAFDQQPVIAQWNLSALAYALTPLIDNDKLNAILDTFMPSYKQRFYQKMALKLGLYAQEQSTLGDNSLCHRQLVDALLSALTRRSIDYAQFFSELSLIPLEQLAQPSTLSAASHEVIQEWLLTYQRFVQGSQLNEQQRLATMQQNNPVYILRNHYAQQAIAAAEQGDYNVLQHLLEALSEPYNRRIGFEAFEQPPVEELKEIALSCSS